ncbi:MAG: NADH:flavin oxidoreductase [Desulfarculaceae bacterium]|nr:NADH:flavin oxidoreductase [Desulfarculaceae bacterium]MCF8073056.1 NADH:flavin oxidoreductase [Desulfarculaceae bacterium]MCF8101859.1 NADH:flavin oxidoreductase [Desulfarculaceae bacterium]MCF8115386.1 NADH:flavin oxidoreductase [Desulfarculaceae bacterium]
MPEPLFQPAALGGLELPNRLVRAATFEGMATDQGFPTARLRELYCRLAGSGVGLIITSGATIGAWAKRPSTLGVLSPLAIHHDRFIEPWAEIVDAVHAQGAKLALQIGHNGRMEPPELRGSAPMAPSAVPLEATGVTPREMTQDDIAEVVELFGRACGRAQAAGFDAVEFHGAHGNLITNFMSPFTNRRSDGYGGSAANRARFAVEVVRRCRELVGPGFTLLMKLSFDDFTEHGLRGQEAVDMAALIAAAGLDGIEVSGGTLSESGERIAVRGVRAPSQEAYFREYARALKQRTDASVILVGGLRSLGVIQEVLAQGEADLVAMSRPFIREPELARRWESGDTREASCRSCNQCFENWMFRPLRCYLDHPQP